MVKEDEHGRKYVNVDTLMRVLGCLAALGAVATGVVSFIYHPSAPGLTLEATIDNINTGFAVCVLTAFVCLAGGFLFFQLLRLPVVRNISAFLIGFTIIGLYFIILGVLCIGIAGLLGFCCGVFCCVVGLGFLIARCFCGAQVAVDLE